MDAGDLAEEGMTTIAIARGTNRAAVQGREGRLQRALLLGGIVSSLLYVATDAIGGLAYEGYSWTSQAVSELMAVGAPSERIVDPLFLVGGVLGLAFGVGVYREGIGRDRARRVAGALLFLYAAVGLTGPTLFEMHPRGTGGASGDLPHIVVTGVIVLLSLLSMTFAARALGGRFRTYTFATVLVMIVFGVVTGTYAPRLGAGQPTPGMGIVERIDIYASLLWMAVLATTLLRRAEPGLGGFTRSTRRDAENSPFGVCPRRIAPGSESRERCRGQSRANIARL